MAKPRKSTTKQNRESYKDVDAIIVSNKANERGKVLGVLRNGIWRYPRLGSGKSALPKAKLPRVRFTK